eukprot:340640_1
MDENWVGSYSNGTSPNHQNVGFPALVMTGLQATINSYLENGCGNTTDWLNKDMECFLDGGEYHKIRSTFFNYFLESLSECTVNEIGNEDGAIKFKDDPDLMLLLEEHWLQHEEGLVVNAMVAYYKAHMKEIKGVVGVHVDDNVPDNGTLLSQLEEYWLQQDDGKILSGLANYYKENMKG